MPSRGDYERRRGPRGHNHNQPIENVKGDIVCILSASSEPNGIADSVVIRVDVDFIAPPIMCRVPSAEAMDKFIDCLVSARNNVWPNN